MLINVNFQTYLRFPRNISIKNDMRITIYLLLLFGNVIELIYLLSFLQFIIKRLCLVWGKHKRDSKAFNRIFIATSSLIVVHMHNNVYPRYHFGRENYYIPGNLWYSTLFKLTEVWKFAVFAIQLQQHTNVYVAV